MNYKCKHCGGIEFAFERKVIEYSTVISFDDDGHGNLYIHDHEWYDGYVDDEPGIIQCCNCEAEWLEHDSKDNLELIEEEEE